MQFAKRWSRPERAFTDAADRVAAGAVCFSEHTAALCAALLRRNRSGQSGENGQGRKAISHGRAASIAPTVLKLTCQTRPLILGCRAWAATCEAPGHLRCRPRELMRAGASRSPVQGLAGHDLRDPPAIGAEGGDLREPSGLSNELFTKPLVEALKTVLH